MKARLAIAAVAALAVAGCGGGGESRSPGTPARAAEGGSVTYCADRWWRTSEASAVRRFNQAHRGEGLAARFRVLARDEFIPEGCDVALMHADWVGRFAAAGRLGHLSEHAERRRDDFVGATLDLARYDDRYWGLPRFADIGLLYYRSNVGTPPFTWQDAYTLARRRGGLVYAGRSDDLVYHFLELAYGAGGDVITDDTAAGVLESEPYRRALELMRRGIESGAVPDRVLRMGDEAARRAFDRGVPMMRNWTYAYGASRIGTWIGDVETDVLEMPAFGSREPAALVTGSSVVIAADAAENPAALALADYLTGRDEAARLVGRFRVPTAMTAGYSDEVEWLDHSTEVERTLERALPQPVTPHWPDIVTALQRHLRAALSGRTPPSEALRAAGREAEAIVAGGEPDESQAA